MAGSRGGKMGLGGGVHLKHDNVKREGVGGFSSLERCDDGALKREGAARRR